MVSVDYKFRLIGDKYFIEKLNKDESIKQIVHNLMFIKASSKNFKGKHNIILKEQSDYCENNLSVKSDIIGKAFHRSSKYENIVSDRLNDIEKNIITGIILAQTLKGKKSSPCYILTSNEKVKVYKENKHMKEVESIKILGYDESKEKIAKYFKKFELKREEERI